MGRDRTIDFCQRGAEVSLWAVIFFLPVSIALTNVGLIAALGFWLVRRALQRDWRFPRTPLNIFFVLLLAVSALSLANSADLPSSISGLRRLLKYFFLFFVIVDTFREEAALRKLMWVMIAGLSVISLDGLVQYLFGTDLIARSHPQIGVWTQFGNLQSARIRASMHNPNDLASYLIAVIPLVLSVTFYYYRGRIKAFLAVVLALACFCLLQTQYRGAGLGLVAVVCILSIVKRDLKPLSVLIILILLVPLLLPRPVIYWAITHLKPYDFLVEEGGRRWHWLAAVNMIKAHPLVGIGINTFSHSYYIYKDPADPYLGWYAHSAYLNIAAETGLIGLMAFLSMIAVSIMAWWKNFSRIRCAYGQAVSLGVLCGLTGYLMAGLLESNLQYSNLAVLFWFMLGILVALSAIPLRKTHP